ncbi:MAG TPA: hypothetical protein VFX18_05725 [Candidatus Nitrosocosmicus sp.]|nr:hypothetical protein [Candidatus Nitrosocosmicus sp.]
MRKLNIPCKICGSYYRVTKGLCHTHYEAYRYNLKHSIGETLCKCGCGQPSKNGNKFAHGHNRKGLVHPNSIRIGPENNFWNGGQRTQYEYKFVMRYNHPLSDVNGYVREHRAVYEDHHKCCLLPWIDIHHINGKKDDNRIENLMPLPRTIHTKIHHKGRPKPKKKNNLLV